MDTPTVPVRLTVWELGLLTGFVLPEAVRAPGSMRDLFCKLRDAAIAAGVRWGVGNPWEER